MSGQLEFLKKLRVTFIEHWLLNTISPMFSVEWAHRVPVRPLLLDAPPHPFSFKMLNYKDRDVILSKARTLGTALVLDNSKISLFTDFSAPEAEVQKQRA